MSQSLATSNEITIKSYDPLESQDENQKTGKLTLPEWKEDDGLDREKLQHWIVGSEKLLSGRVEEEERIEGQAHAEVVDDGYVQVATMNPIKTKATVVYPQTRKLVWSFYFLQCFFWKKVGTGTQKIGAGTKLR